MKTRMKKLLQLGVAGLFAFSLGLAPAIVGSTVANADPDPKLPVSSIDLTKRGSITVHKYLTGVPSTIIGTGKADAELPSDAKTLENVKFRLKKVPLTPAINTPAGLKAATSVTVTAAQAATKSDEGTIQFTAAGETTFTNLEPGVYLVTEEMPDKEEGDPIPNLTVPDPDKKIFDPDVHTLIPAAPFLVMIPMTYSSKDADDNPTSEWNYNVHVFPKNQKSQSTKTVTDKDIQAGSKLTYVISGDVPPIAAGDTLENFTLIDNVDKSKLVVTQADVTGVSIVPSSGESTPLASTDYTVALSTDPEKKPGKDIVTVTLTTAGLQKVQTATGGALGYKVSMTLTAKVRPVDDELSEPGHIKNDGEVITNNGSGAGDVTTPTNETETIYGKLKIHKFAKDGTDTEKNLAGAKFQLYYCAEGAEPKVVGDPISVDGNDSWTTGLDGTVVINGLHVTDRIDDKEVGSPNQRKYCLVETVAPAGYELLPAPVPVTFTSTELGTVDIAMKTEKIENYPSTTPWLPMTGGPGIIVMVLAGIAIIVGGTVYGLRSRSKK